MATGTNKTPAFEIGLVMAGAISAGAYTAGVMDYLIETLDRWETAKEKNRQLGENHPDYDKSIPMYDVVISTLGGASAGGITSIITAIAIQSKIEYITLSNRNNQEAKKSNLLYDTWVNLMADDMLPLLLKDSDIKPGQVVSLFNSEFIEDIAKKVIRQVNGSVPRKYFTPEIELIVSLSSLVGIPYMIGFRSDEAPGNYYKMKSYRDFGHFIMQPVAEYADGRIPVKLGENNNLDVLRACAMATGAFPIGLASRDVIREAKFIRDNKFLLELIGTGEPDLSNFQGDTKYQNLVVDGGLMNNEPFEVVQKILRKKTNQSIAENESYQTFKSSIIMIDPFPSEDVAEKVNENGLESSRLLRNVVGKIYSAMRGQLLFKPEDIQKAYDPNNASRFMIVPSRAGIDGYKAIACGSFGGFGGFFHKKFREHDFFLGRRNCQKFLRDVLTAYDYSTNPIFSKGYSEPESVLRFALKKQNSGIQVPIIPDVSFDRRKGSNPVEENLSWPVISEDYMLQYKGKVKNRTWKIISNLTKLNTGEKFLLWAGYKLLLSRKINTKVMNVMVDSLKNHKLIN